MSDFTPLDFFCVTSIILLVMFTSILLIRLIIDALKHWPPE